MENVPKFIKDFSKEDPDARRQAAQEIRAARAFERMAGQKEKPEPSEREKLQEEIFHLRDKIESLTADGVERIEESFRLDKLRADIAIGPKNHETLSKEEKAPANPTENGGPDGQSSGREILKAFYAEQKAKWEKSGCTKEDMRKYLNEEHLSSLNMEEYILLMRRFPSEMIAHVTRQGVRDHVGHAFHRNGENVFHNGFKEITKSGRLKNALGIKIVEGQKEESIAKFLKLDQCQNRRQAMDKLLPITRPIDQEGSYADRSAVHFAAEEVSDAYYGSEKGNEIFVAYPSAYIAANYYFTGRLDEGGGGYWNDQWVYVNEEKGMSLDAGLVFIPSETSVDPKTGSRYELDKDGNPIPNDALKNELSGVLQNPSFRDFSEEAIKKLYSSNFKSRSDVEAFRQKLQDEYGVMDRKAQMAVLDYDFLKSGRIKDDDPQKAERLNSTVESALEASGLLFKAAKDAIPAKEYWEKYFQENPGQKPSKIVYYDEDDPTRALHEWRKKNGLEKRAADLGVNLNENKVTIHDPPANLGLDRFENLAMQAINDRFPEAANTPEDAPPPDMENEDDPPPLD